MSDIGIGIIGGGYMGKAHSVAFASVASVFDTALRPILVTICSSTPESAENYRKAYGFKKATSDWHDMVADPDVHAIVIASPQVTHHDIALAALAAGSSSQSLWCSQHGGVQLHSHACLTTDS